MAKDTIRYLDNILKQEEARTEEANQVRRRISISRSGRFKSKNKQREALDETLFDASFNTETKAQNQNRKLDESWKQTTAAHMEIPKTNDKNQNSKF